MQRWPSDMDFGELEDEVICINIRSSCSDVPYLRCVLGEPRRINSLSAYALENGFSTTCNLMEFLKAWPASWQNIFIRGAGSDWYVGGEFCLCS